MHTYYCHDCLGTSGLTGSVESLNLTGTSYQLEKFIKHTSPTALTGKISVFNSPNYPKYRDLVVSASLSGYGEVDSQSRVNVIYYANEQTGITLQDGVPSVTGDSVKVVLPHNPTKIHAYPISSDSLSATVCSQCAKLLFTSTTGI